MNKQAAKQQLKNWIDRLEDQAVLASIQSLKRSTEKSGISREDLPNEVKKAINKSREDVKAGRIISNKRFWEKYEHRL